MFFNSNNCVEVEYGNYREGESDCRCGTPRAPSCDGLDKKAKRAGRGGLADREYEGGTGKVVAGPAMLAAREST